MRPKSGQELARKRPFDTTGVMIAHDVTAGNLDLATSKLDLKKIFDNDRLVEIEIGSGKGTFIIARSKLRPDLNLLGIEYAKPYCLYTADRVRRHDLQNVRMLCCDAGALFTDCLADQSLWRVHIYFPDPWPKRKHHRRRLIQPEFISQVRRTLKIGGQLLIVTDHFGYFQQIRQVVNNAEGFAEIPRPKAGQSGEIVGTNFERKYLSQGRLFYSAGLLRYR